MAQRSIGPVTGSATVGASVALLIAWGIQTAFGIVIDAPVQGALAVVCTAIGGLVGGWLVKPGDGKHEA